MSVPTYGVGTRLSECVQVVVVHGGAICLQFPFTELWAEVYAQGQLLQQSLQVTSRQACHMVNEWCRVKNTEQWR